jgi:hypothetical protein
MATPEKHHELGPSALKYIEICPGYRSSGETNVWAEEGTKLHLAAETANLEGLDEEQLRAVIACLDYLEPLEKKADEVHKEMQVQIRYGDA